MNTVQCSSNRPKQLAAAREEQEDAGGAGLVVVQCSIQFLLKFPEQFSVSGIENGQGKYSDDTALCHFSLQVLKIQIKNSF